MLNREEINAAARRCDGLYRQGNWGAALDGYLDLLGELTLAIATGEFAPNAAYLAVIERVADLSAPFGYFERADRLLEGMSALCQDHGNEYFADYAILKRIHVAFMRGEVSGVERLLRQMAPRIGEFTEIDYSADGLKRWEESCRWRNADRDGRRVLLALLCLEIGRYWASEGKYERAQAVFARCQIHSTGTVPELARETHLPLLLQIANVQLELGELNAARQSLDALETAIDPALHPAHAVRRLEMLAKLDLLEGQFGSAEERLREAVELCSQRRFLRGVLIARLNLAHVKIFLSQFAVARHWLDAVKAIAEGNGDREVETRAAFLLRLLDAQTRIPKGGEAVLPISRLTGKGGQPPAGGDEGGESQFDDREIEQRGSLLGFFEDCTVRFYQHLVRNDAAAAAGFIASLEDRFGESESQLLRTRFLVLRGIASYYEGRAMPALAPAEEKFRQAEDQLNDACARLETLGLTPELWQARRVLVWCQTRLGREKAAIDRLRDQAEDLLAQLTESLPAEERASFIINNWTSDEEKLAALVGEIADLDRKLAGRRGILGLLSLPLWISKMKRIHELLLRIDRHKGALSRKQIEGRDDSSQSAPPADSLWRRLWRHPRRRATLSFLVLPDRVVAIRSGFLFLRIASRQILRSEVRDLVSQWHLNASPRGAARLLALSDSRQVAPFPGGMSGQPKKGKEDEQKERQKRGLALNEIAKVMSFVLSLGELLSDLPPETPLTIVPDDGLHGFPFAAIHYEEEHLIQRHPLSLSFESAPIPESLDPRGAQEILLVAVPESAAFETEDGKTFFAPAIHGTKAELDLVEAWFKAKSGLRIHRSDRSAGKEWVMQRLQTASSFHIACHGYPSPDSPDRSGLVLIPESGQAEVLTLRELAGLSLDRLQFVTLSSCWSADNFVLPGRWVISLPESLWRAGARSILGCLWEVDDRIAIAFMSQFHDYLNDNPRDLALRKTQIDCLQGTLPPGDDLAKDAANWAGYNLYGDYRALKLSDRSTTANQPDRL